MDVNNERNVMVRAQLMQRGITDSRVLDAMATVPRHLFVPPEARARLDWAIDFGPYRLLEQSRVERPNGRVDHAFVYEREDVKLGERVDGDDRREGFEEGAALHRSRIIDLSWNNSRHRRVSVCQGDSICACGSAASHSSSIWARLLFADW